MKYYIFRHGETYFTQNNLSYGEHIIDAQILPESTYAIEKMSEYLGNIETTANFASEFKRVQQTIVIVSKIAGKKFVSDKRLNEYMDPREMDGADYPSETFEQLRDRVSDFVADIVNINYKSIMICTHGAVISALKHLLTEGEFRSGDLYDFPRPGMLTIINDDKSIEEIDFNQK